MNDLVFMTHELHKKQPFARRTVAPTANDDLYVFLIKLRMARPSRTTTDGKKVKTHYIRDWADRRGFSQAAIARELDVDKSTVSRWFNGSVPSEHSLLSLAALFQIEVPAIFRDPDDDWLARFFRERTADEKERAKKILEAVFTNRAA